MNEFSSTKPSDGDIAALSAFLERPERPEGTLSFQELQGFLFAVACAPETVMPTDWLPAIGNDEDLGYRDADEAQRILESIMAVYNHINAGVLDRSDAMPQGCEFLTDTEDNFDDDSAVSQWSRGFALGHDWLADLWNEYVSDELDKELGACVMTLTFFGSRALAEAYYREHTEDTGSSDAPSVGDLAKTVRELFPSALASYAHLGRTIFEVVSEGASSNGPSRGSSPVS